MTRRIELEKSSVQRIKLEGSIDLPDALSFRVVEPLESERGTYTMDFEVPTWVLTDEDIALLRELSFLEEATVRIVLEVEE